MDESTHWLDENIVVEFLDLFTSHNGLNNWISYLGADDTILSPLQVILLIFSGGETSLLP